MTPLLRVLQDQITSQGPMSLADYMSLCLMHPEFGYYATRDPFGVDGDFTTSPEISQMFGELVGLSLAQSWLDQGAPDPFVLAEFGPGRGTLMADLLRATKSVPGFHAAARLHLVETSPHLRRMQAERLPGPVWHDSVNTLPEAPLFVIANEFFDALPIRQYMRERDGWCERQIGLVDERLQFGLTGPLQVPALSSRLEDVPPGKLVEHCPAAAPIAAELGQKIALFGGAALIIDYGDWGSLGDTLQALRAHQSTDPLAHPGQADLTAHVDFEVLAKAAPCAHSRLATQGVFLERLGIVQRARNLAAPMSGPELEVHISAFRRLTHPQEMGTLFKVLGLYPSDALPPPGLEP